jgi:hypothetical protein
VPLRQSLDCGESGNIDFAAKLSDAADQAFFGYAVGAVVPTGAFLALFAFLSLQDPLQWIIDYSPSVAELRQDGV